MELLKLIKNRISSEWKKNFNDNVDILNRIIRGQNQKIDVTNKRIDNVVLHSGGDSPNEVVDARVNNKGETFDTLESRLLAAENRHDEDVENTNGTLLNQQKQMEQLNNGIGKLMGTYGATIDLFVSIEKGDDKNGDGTEQNPFATIQMAVNQIPLISSARATIWVDDGVYLENVILASIFCVSLTIRTIQNVDSFDLSKVDLPVKVRSIGFASSAGYFHIYGLQAVDTANAIQTDGNTCAFFCKQGGYLALNKVKCAENTSSSTNYNALYVNGNSKMNIYYSHFVNQAILLRASAMSTALFSGTNTGSGNVVGISADSGAIVTDASSTTSGSTTKYKVQLGLVVTKGQVFS
ncbi:hypothetical protein [Enterococcus avium]|uniref:hypothetical protein n=1 Tax=Enterococcus avium TaxID=33945 RepID=UPI002890229F|nr:hypothetical protein [Enterococcus avium]MDT2395448.1 hypothetical protein [Enterococcus avium]MDT2441710.1 hypothetical protein [Enterococcus avium]MDT2454656.1 hypothetical protein [Enterococcus avium]